MLAMIKPVRSIDLFPLVLLCNAEHCVDNLYNLSMGTYDRTMEKVQRVSVSSDSVECRGVKVLNNVPPPCRHSPSTATSNCILTTLASLKCSTARQGYLYHFHLDHFCGESMMKSVVAATFRGAQSHRFRC